MTTNNFALMPWVSTMQKSLEALSQSSDPDDIDRAALIQAKIDGEKKRMKRMGKN